MTLRNYRALSVVAPAGDRIASGEKRLEIRRWQPDQLPLRDLLIVQNLVRLSQTGPWEDPHGVAVALVDVMVVREWKPEDVTAACATSWEPGWLVWELENVRPLSFGRKAPARLRIYEVNLDVGGRVSG